MQRPILRPRAVSFFRPMTWLALLSSAVSAHAADVLPYTSRARSYSGFNAPALGDIRTTGMGGATVGLADTFLAAASNPAGLAMTLGIGDTNSSRNSVKDGYVQNPATRIETGSVGAALNSYPWGFSVGSLPTGYEGQSYLLTTAAWPGRPASLTVAAQEFRFAVARLFLENRLALGASLNLGSAEEELAALDKVAFDEDHHAVALGATFGAMIQFPERILVGLSHTLPMHYRFEGASFQLPGFFQSIDVPSRTELAVGWIPNRFFRANGGIQIIGRTEGAAMLSDQTRFIGRSVSFQPKLGLAYTFLDYENFRGIFFAGAYREPARVDGTEGRLHKTGGFEFKAWVVNTGIGVDQASQYDNLILSLGIDLGQALIALKLVPKPWLPPHQGWLPNPFFRSDQGLARPLVADWKPQGPDMNPLKLIADIPKNAKKQTEKLLGTSVKDSEKDKRKDRANERPTKKPPPRR